MALPRPLRRLSESQKRVMESVPESTEARPVSVGRFDALQVPVFRRYFFASVISNIGSWMQILAQGWLILSLTDSPFYLGLVGLVRAVPTIALSMIGGVIADRFDRRHVLLITQVVMLSSSLALGALAATGLVEVWHILLITFLSAIFFAVDNPTRQALVPDLVGKDRLTSAIGLNSAAWNGAAIIGPSIAGILIALVSISGAFFLNAASYVPVIFAVLAIPPIERMTQAKRSVLGQLGDGLSYIRSQRAIWGVLLLIAIPSLGARPYIQMMPVFARDVLGLGAGGYGVLMGFSGIGALVGALATASLGSSSRRGILLLVVTGSLGVALVGFSQSRWLAVSLALVLLVGGASTMMMSTANALLQGLVPGDMRGRVMSVYTLIAGGFMPFGSMLMGSLGSVIGVPAAVGIGGFVTIVTAVMVSRTIDEVGEIG